MGSSDGLHAKSLPVLVAAGALIGCHLPPLSKVIRLRSLGLSALPLRRDAAAVAVASSAASPTLICSLVM